MFFQELDLGPDSSQLWEKPPVGLWMRAVPRITRARSHHLAQLAPHRPRVQMQETGLPSSSWKETPGAGVTSTHFLPLLRWHPALQRGLRDGWAVGVRGCRRVGLRGWSGWEAAGHLPRGLAASGGLHTSPGAGGCLCKEVGSEHTNPCCGVTWLAPQSGQCSLHVILPEPGRKSCSHSLHHQSC